jgi:hypothetical protein
MLKEGYRQNSNFYLQPLNLAGKEGDDEKLFRMGYI